MDVKHQFCLFNIADSANFAFVLKVFGKARDRSRAGHVLFDKIEFFLVEICQVVVPFAC